MNEVNKIEEVLKEAKRIVTPTKEEENHVKSTANYLINELNKIIKELNIKAEVHLEGSTARDTWLPGDRDLDIFILFDKSISIDQLRSYGLKIAYELANRLGLKSEERYAEHPYLKVYYKDFEIDIVPAYKISSPSEVTTAVDRTHLHTKYLLSKLSEEQKTEVRLLKKFMKGIGVYGAEIKVGGFSGYLCELLIIYYGDFINTLKNVTQWKIGRTIIDVERHYSETEYKKLRRMFKSPLIVIDPVDKDRNAAAAVTPQRMAEFIMASKIFLQKPSLKFFNPPKEKPLTLQELKEELRKRELDVLAIKVRVKCPSPDILWGQIYRSLKNFVKFIEQFEFKVIDWSAWSNEKDVVVFLLCLESYKLPEAQLHYGPPLGSTQEENFVKKYIDNENVFAGPFIRGNRWFVIRKRKYKDIRDLIFDKYKVMGFVKDIGKAMEKGFEIYLNEDIIKACSEEDYLIHLRKWLFRRYTWLS